ncbi:MAG: hypothetical protein ABF904_15435 [Ethanoligenens sp.]
MCHGASGIWWSWLRRTPTIPTNWQTVVKPDTEKQFNVLTGLLHRADVEEVTCATDVGQYQGVAKTTGAR